jgi:hypothetical protein
MLRCRVQGIIFGHNTRYLGPTQHYRAGLEVKNVDVLFDNRNVIPAAEEAPATETLLVLICIFLGSVKQESIKLTELSFGYYLRLVGL